MLPLPTASAAIAAAGLALGAVAGFAMHRSDFCLAGAFRDLFLFRRTRLLRALLLLVCVTAALVEAVRLGGGLPLYPFPLLGAPSAATAVGGLLFGGGMVLAGGCVIGVLYQAGAARASAWIALAGMVGGSALYAELFPWLRSFDQATRLLGGARTLPQWLGLDPVWLVAPAFGAGATLLWRTRSPRRTAQFRAAGAVEPWKAALVLSGVTVTSLLVVGMPLGVTTSYAKVAAALEALVAPEHVAGVAYFRAAPLDYTHPWTGLRLAGGPTPLFDGVALAQVPVIVGVILGAASSAALLGELRLRPRLPPRQVLSALAGGVLMALGSRMGAGCNLWHLFGGLPVLATTSLLFCGGLLPGAWLGSRILVHVILYPADGTSTTVKGGLPCP